MRAAYVDSSCIVAIRFDEPGAREMSRRLAAFDVRYSSNLLEAEFQSALARERSADEHRLIEWMTWVLPDRPLSSEIGRVLSAGYVRGSDLWHLANALYLAETPTELPFVTLDARQREVATALGFPTV
jgi:hypothetical protein